MALGDAVVIVDAEQTMRDRIYLAGFLVGSGLLLYASRSLLTKSALVTWGLLLPARQRRRRWASWSAPVV